MSYKSKDEICEIVKKFENGTISREDWRHKEHLIVAFFYAFHHDYETALTKMRDGIFNLLRAFEVDLSMEMPYHETLTVFWMKKVFETIESRDEKAFVETANRVCELGADKDLPLKFYSRELLFSDAARKNFVASDL